MNNALNNKHLIKFLISLLCLTIVVLILLKQQPGQPEASLVASESPKTTLDTQTKALTAPEEQAVILQSSTAQTAEHKTEYKTEYKIKEQQLAELIKQRLTPEMRAEINARLNPPNESYTEITTEYGGYVNLGKRAGSVSIAVIDDNGNTVVTDITRPLTE